MPSVVQCDGESGDQLELNGDLLASLKSLNQRVRDEMPDARPPVGQ